jgi:hypothetical protein
MNFLSFCVAPLVLCAAPIQANGSQADPTLVALTCIDDSSLATLRGGAPELSRPLDDQETATLRAADAAAGDLADLRGGSLDDHDLTVIAVVALAIIAIAIIL